MDVVPCDADKHGSLNDIFYAVNKAQHFEFPHANCDTYTNRDLAALYFKQSGFGSHCCGVIASVTGVVCDLSALASNSQFVNYVTAWMRLKFVAEQVDPVRYARYFERGIIPAHKTPKLPAELLELYKADSTEFYAFVDRLANTIQMQWLGLMTGRPGCPPGLDIVCTWINSELPTIRSRLSPACSHEINPYDLSIKPFLEYHRGLRRVLLCLDA
jgi:hypothetical protein